MRRMLLGLMVSLLFAVPSIAVPTIEFSPTSGGWSYNGAGTLSFTQVYPVWKGLGSSFDTLVGAHVHIPNFTVGGIVGGPYTLTPSGAITITDVTDLVTYLTGTLGIGDLYPVGSTGNGYTMFQTDITGITVSNTIGSAALAAIGSMAVPALDFELTLNGAGNFKDMLDNGKTGSDGFSGSMTAVPVPGAILLAGMGTALVGWLKRRRTV